MLSELKKKVPSLASVNTAPLHRSNPDEVTVDIERAGEAEMDERWSFVRRKNNPRWLWHAIDHQTGKMLAYVFGRRKDEVCLKLEALLEPFGLIHYSTDMWGVYTRHLDPKQHTASKQTLHKANRASASDGTNPHQTPGA